MAMAEKWKFHIALAIPPHADITNSDIASPTISTLIGFVTRAILVGFLTQHIMGMCLRDIMRSLRMG
ncbi:unnamed protein product [Periconia digitata]|uniref:Uncharacterized protein n=1 Tax=Periconia digitata TaxID=1303443 RepID=A0A9W4UMR9_9PLEO|nr:unnamed protein product [Periconia digitata]